MNALYKEILRDNVKAEMNGCTYVSTPTGGPLPFLKSAVLACPPGRASASNRWTSWSLCSFRSYPLPGTVNDEDIREKKEVLTQVAASPEAPAPITATFISSNIIAEKGESAKEGKCKDKER